MGSATRVHGFLVGMHEHKAEEVSSASLGCQQSCRMQPNQEDVAGYDAREFVRSVYAGLLSNRHLARAHARQV